MIISAKLDEDYWNLNEFLQKFEQKRGKKKGKYQNVWRKFAQIYWDFEVNAVQRCINLVDLHNGFEMSMWFQKIGLGKDENKHSKVRSFGWKIPNFIASNDFNLSTKAQTLAARTNPSRERAPREGAPRLRPPRLRPTRRRRLRGPPTAILHRARRPPATKRPEATLATLKREYVPLNFRSASLCLSHWRCPFST